MGVFRPGDIARELFPTMRGADLFTYCFRRFGYPSSGWDDYKEICRYNVTTPEPDIFLTITPHCGRSGQDSWLSFGYLIEKALEEEYYQLLTRRGHQDALSTRGNTALTEALKDLRRPVPIRDVLITCTGPLLAEGDEEELPAQVSPFVGAGFGIPRAFLLDDPDRYSQFLEALAHLGKGDSGQGIERVIHWAEQERHAQ